MLSKTSKGKYIYCVGWKTESQNIKLVCEQRYAAKSESYFLIQQLFLFNIKLLHLINKFGCYICLACLPWKHNYSHKKPISIHFHVSTATKTNFIQDCKQHLCGNTFLMFKRCPNCKKILSAKDTSLKLNLYTRILINCLV